MRNPSDELRPQLQRLLSIAESIDERLARLEASSSRHGQHLSRQGEQLTRMEDAQTRHAAQLTHFGEQLTRMGEQLTHVGEELTLHGEHLTQQGEKLAKLETAVAQSLAVAAEARAQPAPEPAPPPRANGNGHHYNGTNGNGHSHAAPPPSRSPIMGKATRPDESRKPVPPAKPHRISLLRRSVEHHEDPADSHPAEDPDAAGSDRRKLTKLQSEVRRLGGRLSDLLDRLDEVGKPVRSR